MKSLACFLVLTLICSIALCKVNHTPCDSPCLACQQTVYNLKFNNKANCPNVYCKSTCYKVHSAWNAPNSPFAEFQSDVFGKCDICFRAGYCSANECSVQYNFELAVISKVVNEASLNGVVDNQEMEKIVKNIVNSNQGNFKDSAAAVTKKVNKVTKSIKELSVKKLLNTSNAVVSFKSPEELKNILENSNQHISKFNALNKNVKDRVNKLISAYQKLLESAKSTKNKKDAQKKEKEVKKSAEEIEKLINEISMELKTYLSNLNEAKRKLASSKEKTVIAQVKKINSVIESLNKSIKDINDAAIEVKKLDNSSVLKKSRRRRRL